MNVGSKVICSPQTLCVTDYAEEKQLQDGSHPLFCEEGSHDCDL